jgi:hypothetical protein
MRISSLLEHQALSVGQRAGSHLSCCEMEHIRWSILYSLEIFEPLLAQPTRSRRSCASRSAIVTFLARSQHGERRVLEVFADRLAAGDDGE